MDEERREKLRSYGASFDEMVDLVANSMGAIGYPSRHAPANRSEMPNELSVLRGLLNDLGMLCLRMNSELTERFHLINPATRLTLRG